MSHPGDSRQATRNVAARAGIVGNPSDGYGGRVVATTIGQLCATVTASTATASAHHTGEGAALLDAARTVAEEWLHEAGRVDVHPTTLRFATDIPRQVGLAGSSAIVIGAIEAIAELHGVVPDPRTVARLALRAEADLLGIAAGPQDRVVQAHRGLLDMDFAEPWDPARYRRLPDEAATGLVVAWDPDPGESSGVVHGDLRARWDAGDPEVREVMVDLAALAALAADVLATRRGEGLAEIIDTARSLRRRLWSFSTVDESLLAIAERAGSAATLAGSGGAIVAAPRGAGAGGPGSDRDRSVAAAALCAAFHAAGARALIPDPSSLPVPVASSTPVRMRP